MKPIAAVRVPPAPERAARGPSARRLALAALGCALTGWALTGCGSGPGGIDHVVVISLDTTRADHLGSYGNDWIRTPRLDELAREGVVFEDVTAPAPTTLASHTSLLSGLTPRSHGVPRNGFRVDEGNTLLAETLAAAGFHTAAFVGSFALDARFGLSAGFDEYDEEFDLLLDGKSYDQNQRRAAAVTDAALEHVRAGGFDRLFLFAHYFDAHNPFDPPAPYDAMYGREDGPRSSGLEELGEVVLEHRARAGFPLKRFQQVFNQGLAPALVAHGGNPPEQRDRDMAALYAGEVSYMDEHVGRLLDGLEEAGILDRALVVLTGDHGESFWEHADFWNHGLWVYDTTVRVPLVLRFPDGRGAGTRVAAPTSTIDLVPTVLELLGLEPAEELEGRSLVRAVDGDVLPPVPIYTEATQPAGAERPGMWRNELKAKAVRRGKWKYVRAEFPALHEQLFDLEADPGETVNLLRQPSAEHLAVRAELAGELHRWRTAHTPRPSVQETEANREVLERLQSLGYFEDS